MSLIQQLRIILNDYYYLFIRPSSWLIAKRQDRLNQPVLNQNRNLKNIHSGKRCVIIGNGASISKMDLSPLKSETVFVVNSFFYHPDFKHLNPSYYACIEPYESFLQEAKSNPLYYPQNYLRKIAAATVHTSTSIFLHISVKKVVDKYKIFSHKRVHYIDSGTSILLTDKFGFQDDITKKISFCNSVVFATVCIAAYMGFTEIYLIGCDEDYFFKNKNFHFYADMGHMVPDIPYGTRNQKTMEKMAYDLSLTFKRWRILYEYFSSKGIHLYNAGIGGVLDVLPRVKFTTRFPKIRKPI